jgi:hypothetical protein
MPQLEGARGGGRSLVALLVLALLVLVALEVLGIIDLVPGLGRAHAVAGAVTPAREG